MAIFDGNMPYTNLHELNLDWVIKKVKELNGNVDEIKEYLENLPIEQAVKDQLQIWLEDGTLADIINQQAFSQLRDDITANTNSISALDTRLTRVENPAILFIGDSYAVGNHLTDPNYAWPHMVGRALGLTLNSTYYVQATGGYGLMVEQGRRFSELLNTWLLAHTQAERDRITHVIMGGGANDWVNNITYLNETADAIKNAVNLYMPNAEVIMIPFGWSINTEYRFGLAEAYRNMNLYLPQYNIKVISGLYKVLQNRSFFDTDGDHPNDNGNYSLSSAIISALVGGQYFNTIRHYFTLNGTVVGYVVDNNGQYTLNFPNSFSYNPVGGTRTDWWDCGEVDCNAMLGVLNGYSPTPSFCLPVIYSNESSARRLYMTEFKIYKTTELAKPHMYARILYPDRSNGTYIFPASGSSMYIFLGSIPLSMPAL